MSLEFFEKDTFLDVLSVLGRRDSLVQGQHSMAATGQLLMAIHTETCNYNYSGEKIVN